VLGSMISTQAMPGVTVVFRNSSRGVVLFVLILYALVNDARAKEAIATGRTLARLA
jgi:hypothetical protein